MWLFPSQNKASNGGILAESLDVEVKDSAAIFLGPFAMKLALKTENWQIRVTENTRVEPLIDTFFF